MSTYYVSNNHFFGSVEIFRAAVAAQSLRMMGAKFTSKKSGSNLIFCFSFCPEFLQQHLLAKYPVKTVITADKKGIISRQEWESRFKFESGKVVRKQNSVIRPVRKLVKLSVYGLADVFLQARFNERIRVGNRCC